MSEDSSLPKRLGSMTVGELIAGLSHREPSQVTTVTNIEDLFAIKPETKLEGSKPGLVPDKRHEILSSSTNFQVREYEGKNTLMDGAFVCAKSGGPLMTVEDLRSDGIVAVVWFVDGQCHRDVLHRDNLNIFVRID